MISFERSIFPVNGQLYPLLIWLKGQAFKAPFKYSDSVDCNYIFIESGSAIFNRKKISLHFCSTMQC